MKPSVAPPSEPMAKSPLRPKAAFAASLDRVITPNVPTLAAVREKKLRREMPFASTCCVYGSVCLGSGVGS